MARMFPPDGPSNPKLHGESQVYRLLAQLDDNFYIFQNRYWIFPNKSGSIIERETDFLLVHPEKGLLIIEVKGGTRFSYNGEHDKWQTWDYNNHPISYNDPYKKQMANSKMLPVFLKDKIPSLTRHWFNCGYAVCFPHIDSIPNTLAPFMKREITLLRDDINDLNHKIDAIYDYHRAPSHKPLGRAVVEEIKNLITPPIELRKSLGAELEDEEQTIIRLTKEQQEILDGFYMVNRPILIEGPAGTGKTQLAIFQAISDLKLNKLVLLITNSQDSKNYLYNEIAININFNKDYLKIFTIKELKLVQETLENISIFDKIKIIIDEAQQLDNSSLKKIARYLEEPRNISMLIFKDDSQKTNDNYIQEIFQPVNNYTLQKVIRNTVDIFNSYKEYVSPSYRVKSPIRTFKEVIINVFTTDQELVQSIKDIVLRLTNKEIEKVLPKYITILFSYQPSKKIIESISSSISNLSFKPFSWSNPIDENTITWSTIYNFQGLENHIILLVELDPEPISETIRLRRLRYIGRSRACSLLYILLRQDNSSIINNIADIF